MDPQLVNGIKALLMIEANARESIARIVGEKLVLDSSHDLSLYEYDGGVDKARPEMEAQVEQVREVCTLLKAREVRVARPAEERDPLWKDRKNAFGAVGRIRPFYYVQDGVVPRTKIAPTLRFIGEVADKYGLKISNIFHGGDGNMHPTILFDARKPGDLKKAQDVGEDILNYCVDVGGSITGEHGAGMEKMELMGHLFDSDSLDMISRFKSLFDPDCHLNPGKVLPTGRGCMEIRQASLTAQKMM